MPPRFGRKAPGKAIQLEPRGYDHAWSKLRKRRLDHDPLCQHCLDKQIITPAKEVDHILPRKLGGQDVWENTQSLCKPCHQAKTKLDLKKMKGRW